MRSAQGATSWAKSNRKDAVLTRHGPHARNHTGAAATSLRLTALAVPDAENCDLMASCDYQFSTRNWRASRKCHNRATSRTARGRRKTIPAIR